MRNATVISRVPCLMSLSPTLPARVSSGVDGSQDHHVVFGQPLTQGANLPGCRVHPERKLIDLRMISPKRIRQRRLHVLEVSAGVRSSGRGSATAIFSSAAMRKGSSRAESRTSVIDLRATSWASCRCSLQPITAKGCWRCRLIQFFSVRMRRAEA